MLAHFLLHVWPWRKHALAVGVRALVEQVVEDFHPEVRHADLIIVREAEREPDVHVRRILFYHPELAACILHRLFHRHQDFINWIYHQITAFYLSFSVVKRGYMETYQI